MEHLIRNFDALATTELREHALAIVEAGLRAADVRAALREKVQVGGDELLIGKERYPLTGRGVHVVAVGKCAMRAAAALEEILGDKLAGGIALDVAMPEGVELKKIQGLVGAHPKPLWENVEASKKILEMLDGLTEDDVVIALVSGGGSALLCLPPTDASFPEEARIFDELTRAGAPITEMNTVRKHLSLARGGGLAKAAYPAAVAALIVSDVPGNDIGTIASAPFTKDATTVANAQAVVEKYQIPLEHLELIETPKEDIYFERVHHLVLVTSESAVGEMWREAERRGFSATIAKKPVGGEAREVARVAAAALRAAPRKSALLWSGETTVTLGTASGKGGRNQELSLAALPETGEDELIISVASDGRDNTDAAAGIADATTRAHAGEKGLDPQEYLGGHRSYDFFQASGDAVMTGQLGTNVADIILALKL